MTRNNVRKVLGQTAQLANIIIGKQNLFHSFPVVGTTKSSSSNNNYSTKAKKENFINIPKQLHNNKLMNIFVSDFKNYSSSSVNSNNTIHVLNPVQYEEWSKDDVCSLLCTPKVNGGAGLTIEDVKPLYDAGFKGTALGNIVTFIQDKDKDYAMKKLRNNNDYKSVSQTTLDSVVNWAYQLFITRLFHLWHTKKINQAISESLGYLTKDETSYLLSLKLSGIQISNSNEKVVKRWKQQYTITCDSVDFSDRILLASFIAKHTARSTAYGLVQPIIDMPFKYNEELVKGISDSFHKLETETDKQNIFIPCLAYASGTGKSRTLQEIFKLTAQGKNYKDNSLEIRISFGNGMTLQEDDNLKMGFLYRILFSYLNIPSFHSNTVASELAKINPTFEDLILTIAQHWRKANNKPKDSPVAIYLAVDEYTKVKEFPRMNFSEIITMVGNFVMLNNQKASVKLFPLFAGLDTAFFERTVSESSFHSNYFTPYKFSDDDELEIVRRNIPSLEYAAPLWKALTFINKHPRMIEWFLDNLKKKNSKLSIYDRVQNAYTVAKNNFSGYGANFVLESETAKLMLAHALTETPINSKSVCRIDSEKLRRLEDSGYIRIVNGLITMSLPMIERCLKAIRFDDNMTEMSFHSLFLYLEEAAFKKFSTHSRDFETFNAHFEIVKNYCFISLGISQMYIKDRFKGIIFQNEMGKKIIDLHTFPKKVFCTLQDETTTKYEIPPNTLVQNSFNSSFFDRFAACNIDNNNWTILWQDKGSISDSDSLSLPAVEKIYLNHFDEQKLKLVGGSSNTSLALIITIKPLNAKLKDIHNLPPNFGILGLSGCEQYYGKFIYRSYLLNISKPFHINKPDSYSTYELALFFNFLQERAARLRSKIQNGEYVDRSTLSKKYKISKSILDDIDFSLPDSDNGDNHQFN